MSLNLVRVVGLLRISACARFALALPLVFGLVVPACGGGSPDVVTRPDLGEGGNGAEDSGNGGNAANPNGGRGGGLSIDPGTCTPTTCEEQEKNCGSIANGCGEILDCGECEDGTSCGLVTANVCATQEDIDELCKPVSEDDACADKECGIEGDGCGGTYECGTCEADEACGGEEAFQCSAIVMGTPDDCPAKIADCASVGAQCGLIGNGCGGTIDCDAETGGCEDGELCGIGGPQLCGSAPTCEPFDAAEACAGKCGIVSNGCGVEVDGGIIDCSALFPCPNGESCGGGGVTNQCGKEVTTCTPVTQDVACGDRECGRVGDGCEGGSYSCGSCSASEFCKDGTCETRECTPIPRSTACNGKTCGLVPDGCASTHNCGTCGTGLQCGLVRAFQCDAPPACVARTRAQACAGKECGTAVDGCGTGQFNCGTCTSGQFCGLKEAFQCDAPTGPTCTPNGTSCAALGWACGKAVNNCGTVYDCEAEGRTCGALETCVGGITGPTTCETTGTACPLCDAVPDCTGRPQVTRLTGRVITPGRTNANTANQIGVPNAFVYILRTNNPADLPAIAAGIPTGASGEACDRCENQDLGSVLVGATTDANGNFVLEGNVPVGQEVLLVVKAGKFRRAQRYTVPAAGACATTNLPTAAATNPTRLPRTRSDGLAVNLPRIAITTGPIDAMECVFEKMGIASSEFVNGSATTTGARIHLYRGAASESPSGASLDGNTPHDSDLYDDLARLKSYDMIVADCEGGSWDSDFEERDDYGANVRDYVNRGGRMFASHLSFSWLHQNGTQAYAQATRFATGLGQAATWQTSAVTTLSDGTGIVSIGRPNASPRIQNFAAWMAAHDIAEPNAYEFDITDPRSQVNSLASGSEEFVYCDGEDCTSARTQQFSFNTPFAAPAARACGRVAYSGFHVAATGGGVTPFANVTFPGHCAGNLTAQEKVLLYMLFDLGACVGDPPKPPGCTPQACPARPACGTRPDGCGGTINCGCPTGQGCSNGQCVSVGCVPTTCEAEGVLCASVADGCGEVLECPCPTCTPKPKDEVCEGVACGTVSDGCSKIYTCSKCPPNCVPLDKCPPGADCGVISDGCNGSLDCGSCKDGKICGGAGTANRCDVPMCPKLACDDLEATCGLIGDGCGGSVDCGTCPPGQVCTTTNGVQRCEGCQPLKCADTKAECGLIGDGCGATVDCGPCPTGSTCGAIEPNKCGGGNCNPRTCGDADAECGLIGDGCGDQIDCGECPPGEVCGLETPFKCAAPPPCEPASCESAGAECGLISDGCNDLVDCGECPPGATCGLVEANRCARVR